VKKLAAAAESRAAASANIQELTAENVGAEQEAQAAYREVQRLQERAGSQEVQTLAAESARHYIQVLLKQRNMTEKLVRLLAAQAAAEAQGAEVAVQDVTNALESENVVTKHLGDLLAHEAEERQTSAAEAAHSYTKALEKESAVIKELTKAHALHAEMAQKAAEKAEEALAENDATPMAANTTAVKAQNTADVAAHIYVAALKEENESISVVQEALLAQAELNQKAAEEAAIQYKKLQEEKDANSQELQTLAAQAAATQATLQEALEAVHRLDEVVNETATAEEVSKAEEQVEINEELGRLAVAPAADEANWSSLDFQHADAAQVMRAATILRTWARDNLLNSAEMDGKEAMQRQLEVQATAIQDLEKLPLSILPAGFRRELLQAPELPAQVTALLALREAESTEEKVRQLSQQVAQTER